MNGLPCTTIFVLPPFVSVPKREAVVARVEVAPGIAAGWHTHPGDAISYVVEGAAMLLIAGQKPRKVAAGEAFYIPAGVVHNAMNHGTVPSKLMGCMWSKKG